MDNFLFKLQKSLMMPAAAICHNTPGRGKEPGKIHLQHATSQCSNRKKPGSILLYVAGGLG